MGKPPLVRGPTIPLPSTSYSDSNNLTKVSFLRECAKKEARVERLSRYRSCGTDNEFRDLLTEHLRRNVSGKIQQRRFSDKTTPSSGEEVVGSRPTASLDHMMFTIARQLDNVGSPSSSSPSSSPLYSTSVLSSSSVLGPRLSVLASLRSANMLLRNTSSRWPANPITSLRDKSADLQLFGKKAGRDGDGMDEEREDRRRRHKTLAPASDSSSSSTLLPPPTSRQQAVVSDDSSPPYVQPPSYVDYTSVTYPLVYPLPNALAARDPNRFVSHESAVRASVYERHGQTPTTTTSSSDSSSAAAGPRKQSLPSVDDDDDDAANATLTSSSVVGGEEASKPSQGRGRGGSALSVFRDKKSALQKELLDVESRLDEAERRNYGPLTLLARVGGRAETPTTTTAANPAREGVGGGGGHSSSLRPATTSGATRTRGAGLFERPPGGLGLGGAETTHSQRQQVQLPSSSEQLRSLACVPPSVVSRPMSSSFSWSIAYKTTSATSYSDPRTAVFPATKRGDFHRYGEFTAECDMTQSKLKLRKDGGGSDKLRKMREKEGGGGGGGGD